MGFSTEYAGFCTEKFAFLVGGGIILYIINVSFFLCFTLFFLKKLIMKNKFLLSSFSLFLFAFLLFIPNAFASNTNGTIDTTYHYGWGENIGWVDFIKVTVTDTTLGGSTYGENIGWIDLSTITNNNEGTLSGYAWGENIGWVDFSKVIIGNDGVFSGSAYGENIGWISFGTTNNKVATDWRPASTRVVPQSSGSSAIVVHRSSGSSALSRYNNLIAMGNTKVAEELQNQFPNQIPNLTKVQETSSPISNIKNPISSITRLLKQGTRGNDIKILQTYLNTHSYDSGIADGIFGPKTKASVIKFQKANNLKPDGLVGVLTRAKMKP